MKDKLTVVNAVVVGPNSCRDFLKQKEQEFIFLYELEPMDHKAKLSADALLQIVG